MRKLTNIIALLLAPASAYASGEIFVNLMWVQLASLIIFLYLSVILNIRPFDRVLVICLYIAGAFAGQVGIFSPPTTIFGTHISEVTKIVIVGLVFPIFLWVVGVAAVFISKNTTCRSTTDAPDRRAG